MKDSIEDIDHELRALMIQLRSLRDRAVKLGATVKVSVNWSECEGTLTVTHKGSA